MLKIIVREEGNDDEIFEVRSISVGMANVFTALEDTLQQIQKYCSVGERDYDPTQLLKYIANRAGEFNTVVQASREKACLAIRKAEEAYKANPNEQTNFDFQLEIDSLALIAKACGVAVQLLNNGYVLPEEEIKTKYKPT